MVSAESWKHLPGIKLQIPHPGQHISALQPKNLLVFHPGDGSCSMLQVLLLSRVPALGSSHLPHRGLPGKGTRQENLPGSGSVPAQEAKPGAGNGLRVRARLGGQRLRSKPGLCSHSSS